MKLSGLSRYALAMGAAAALLTGCGGSQPIGATSIPSAHAGPIRRASGSNGDLLYVASVGYGVFVLTYPGLGLVTQFSPPNGRAQNLCSDAQGDVFVTIAEGFIDEYLHGGTTPIATINDHYYNYMPTACRVSPTTGDLAVVNYGVAGPNIAVWQKAQGSPTYYTYPGAHRYFSAAYDEAGNLFVDLSANSAPVVLAEIPSGGSSFATITLNERFRHEQPGTLQWVGNYLAMSLLTAKKGIYRVKVTGTTGKVTKLTPVVKGLHNEWLIAGATLMSPHGPGRCAFCPGSRLGIWSYPQGGAPTQILDLFGRNSDLMGETISVGSSQRK